MRWNQNITYKRRLSMLLLYKSHIAVVCSKISQTTKQKQINKEEESVASESDSFSEDTASNEVGLLPNIKDDYFLVSLCSHPSPLLSH
jgi:hypothetical protein